MNVWRLKLDVNNYGFRYLDVDEEYEKKIRYCERIEEKNNSYIHCIKEICSYEG